MNVASETYVQVFSIPGKSWWVVLLLPQNVWGMEKEDRFVEFTTPNQCMPLLPMLEFTYSQALEMIRQGIQQTDVSPKLLEDFPFDNILYLALTWPTHYWPSLAVTWLEEGYPISEELINLLKITHENKTYPQRLRHRSMRLINRHA